MWGAMKATSVPQRLGEPDYAYVHRLKDRIVELEVIAREVISVHEDADHGADIPIYIYKLAKAAMEQK